VQHRDNRQHEAGDEGDEKNDCQRRQVRATYAIGYAVL
jgi:hypothetical protein